MDADNSGVKAWGEGYRVEWINGGKMRDICNSFNKENLRVKPQKYYTMK